MTRTGDRYGSHIGGGGFSHLLAGMQRMQYVKSSHDTNTNIDALDYKTPKQIDTGTYDEKPEQREQMPAGADVVIQELHIGQGTAREEQRLRGTLQEAPKQKRQEPPKKLDYTATYDAKY